MAHTGVVRRAGAAAGEVLGRPLPSGRGRLQTPRRKSGQEKEVASQREVMGPFLDASHSLDAAQGVCTVLRGEKESAGFTPDWSVNPTGWHGHPLIPETPGPGKAC